MLRYSALKDSLNERQRRLFAASEARAYGYGGIKAVALATGIAPSTIGRGLHDLDQGESFEGVVRRPGGGRDTIAQNYPTLLDDLERLLNPDTMGDPMRPLLWVSKSHAKISDALKAMGYPVSSSSIPALLVQAGYRRQANRKTREGTSHPDRDAQFEHINANANDFVASGDPVISVDTKKKEILGDFKNNGTDYRPNGSPLLVKTHDFMDKTLGKAIPYGIYDIEANAGMVSVGIDNDTSEFAVNSIRLWWEKMGHDRYPASKRLMITADGGGSNGSRVKLWKRELQSFANKTGLSVTVNHYPPGSSKWNKIEHRLFCHISQNWRGRPLIDRMTVVELIAGTKTCKGLTVQCELDLRTYEKGIKVTQEEMESLHIIWDRFHPEWNYEIIPGERPEW